jgi:raffinose/stachyose/melibiose transport system substrate-binding protein
MHTRRFAAAALAAAGILAVTSTLRILATTNDKPAMDPAVEAFKAANPGTEVNVTYADVDNLQTTLRTQLSAGTGPDVFNVWPGSGNAGGIGVLAEPGYLADLSARPWAAQVAASDKPLVQVDGKTYAVPINSLAVGAIYNGQALQQAGLTAPTTWSELLSFCAAAKAKSKAAFALGVQTDWVTQMVPYSFVATLVYGKDPEFNAKQSAGQVTFAGSAWKQALDKYLEMNSKGCFNASPNGTSYEASLTMVAKGEALGVVQVTSALPALQQQAGSGVEFSFAPLPATDSAADTFVPASALTLFGVNAKSKNADLANKFVDFLASATEINKYATTSGGFPAISNDAYQANTVVRVILDYRSQNKTVAMPDAFWPNPKVQATHFTGVQELFAGKATPEKVLSEMDSVYKG